VQSSLGDLFQLQDDIARRVVEALALPLAGGAHPDSPTPEAPKSPSAYSIYLRANEQSRTYEGLLEARTLYERAVALDPSFAPAWAQLGRCHRVIGKFIAHEPESTDRAEDALQRALKLAPRLSVAHKYYAQVESETGQPRAALARLLREASRHGNDPELFAGLVHACRYCGLLEPSVAAHQEAVRLDPNVPTSVEGTLLLIGDIDRLLSFERRSAGGGADGVIRVIGLGLAGRLEESRAGLRELADGTKIASFQAYTDTLLGWLDRRPDAMQVWEQKLGALKIMEDPEALFQGGWLLCDAGDPTRGIPFLRRAVDKGYSPAATLAGSPAFAGLHGDPAFQAVLRDAEAACQEAERVFRAEGGAELLGIARERGAA
jgi:tetratricopeptide (TPR) repeat protein